MTSMLALHCLRHRFERVDCVELNRRRLETSSGDPLLDAEALVSFVKMEDGLLTNNQVMVTVKRQCCLWVVGQGGSVPLSM